MSDFEKLETGNQEEQNPEQVEATTTDEKVESVEQDDPRKVLKYSDDDVDRIVKRRLAIQHKKFEKILNPVESDLDRREREVTQRELKADGKERLLEAGLPADLIKLMNINDKESFEESYKNVTTLWDEVFTKQKTEFIKPYLAGKTPKIIRSTDHYRGDPIKKAFTPKE
mgnify:CR=1 FL=1